MDENTNATAPTPVEPTTPDAPVETIVATPEVLSENPALVEAGVQEGAIGVPATPEQTEELNKKLVDESGINDGGVNFETTEGLADVSHLDGQHSCGKCGRDESPTISLCLRLSEIHGWEKLCVTCAGDRHLEERKVE